MKERVRRDSLERRSWYEVHGDRRRSGRKKVGRVGSRVPSPAVQVGNGRVQRSPPGQRGGPEGQCGWARVGEPEWTAQSCFEVTVLGLAGCWVLGALTRGGRIGPGTTSPAPCDGPVGSRAGRLPWVPGRGGTCRVPDMTGSLQGSGVGGWARWFSCIHGRMSSGLSGRSLGSPGFACLLALSLSLLLTEQDRLLLPPSQ